MTKGLTRRAALGVITAGVVTACTAAKDDHAVLRVGDQRGGSRVVLTGADQLRTPYSIEWSQFPNAAPLLEALNAGAIDTGIGGDSAFIFAIGSGARIKAIGAQKSIGLGPVVVVRGNSSIRTLDDLVGKRIATPRGSISHNHILAILESLHRPFDAVTFAFLSPADGRAALQSGAVDAWAIWDPNAALAQQEGARILPSKANLVPGYTLMFGSDGAIAEKKPLLADYHRRLYAGWNWAATHRDQYSELMHRETGLALDILKVTNTRSIRLPVPIDAALIAQQQETADRYYRAGLIPGRIDVRTGFNEEFT